MEVNLGVLRFVRNVGVLFNMVKVYINDVERLKREFEEIEGVGVELI